MVLIKIDSIANLLKPMKNHSDPELIRTYDILVKQLLHAGITPRKQVISNVISKNTIEHITVTYHFQLN